MMPKQIFLRCAVVLFLSCLPSALHAQLFGEDDFLFGIGTTLDQGVNGHVDVFYISADKPVAELHLSIDSFPQHDDLTRWSPSFPPPLSPTPNVSSTLESSSMTYDVFFSPAAPLPAGTYEIAFLDINGAHGTTAISNGAFSDGSRFDTDVFIFPEPSTLTLGSIALLFFLGFVRRRRK